MKGTLPKIASTSKNNKSDAEFSDDTSPIEEEKGVNDIKDDRNEKNDEGKDVEFPDGTSPVDTEKGVSERKDDKNEKNYEGKDVECPDETTPDDMEEGVSDRNDDNNEKSIMEDRQNAQMALLLMIWSNV